MFPFELLLSAGVLSLFFVVVLLPPGHLIIKRLFQEELSPELQLLLSLGCGVLLWTLPVAAVCLSPLPNEASRILLTIFAIIAFALWLRERLYRSFLRRSLLFPGFSLFLVLLASLLITAPPIGDIRDISISQTMLLSQLPTDLLIPYNVSRYLVEKINFNAIEVVPTWRASDRGPLAGVINALFFILLGIEERGSWLAPTPKFFSVYQTLLTFLNLSAGLFVWCFTKTVFGRLAAGWALALFTFNYFIFLNTFSPWPKLFMAALFLTGVFLLHHLKRPFLGGVFFAGAHLAHDSAIFGVVACLLFLLLRGALHQALCEKSLVPSTMLSHGTIQNLFHSYLARCFCGFLLCIAPWSLFKVSVAHPSPRGLYIHLFCNTELAADSLSFSEALSRYLAQNTVGSIFSAKGSNLIFPFDPTSLLSLLPNLLSSPVLFVHHSAGSAFHSLLFGLGVVPGLLALSGLLRWARSRALLPYLGGTFGHLLLYALFAGCPSFTYNHHWAYATMLFLFSVAGGVAAQSGGIVSLLLGLSLGYQLCLCALVFFYLPEIRPFLHTNLEFRLTFGAILGSLVLLLLFELNRGHRSA